MRTFWPSTRQGIQTLSRQLGSASAPLNNPLKCWAGPDRTVSAGHTEGDVRRYDANGDPVPFNAALPAVPDNLPHEIRFYAHEVGLPRNAPGYPQPVGGYLVAGNSGFGSPPRLRSTILWRKPNSHTSRRTGLICPNGPPSLSDAMRRATFCRQRAGFLCDFCHQFPSNQSDIHRRVNAN
jgi:hypothetical protein